MMHNERTEPRGPLWWQNRAPRLQAVSNRSVIGALRDTAEAIEAAWHELSSLRTEHSLLWQGVDPEKSTTSIQRSVDCELAKLDRKFEQVDFKSDMVSATTTYDPQAYGPAHSGNRVWNAKPEAVQLSRRQLLQSVFDAMDLDNSGHITMVELITLAETRRKLGHMAGMWNEKKNTHLLSKIDKSGDGMIERLEFVDYYDETLSPERDRFLFVIDQFRQVAATLRREKRDSRQFEGQELLSTRGGMLRATNLTMPTASLATSVESTSVHKDEPKPTPVHKYSRAAMLGPSIHVNLARG